MKKGVWGWRGGKEGRMGVVRGCRREDVGGEG